MKGPNPYKGLFPYTADDEPLFFGREKEAADLVEMIKMNQFVVLFGESGTGKTSLINAKLFPTLLRQYYFPILIRINFTAKESPREQIRRIIYSELKKWDSSVPEFKPGMSLLQYASITKVFSGLVKPVLFFDQFEEIFTVAPGHMQPQQLEELVDDIGSLTDGNIPLSNNKDASEGNASRLQKSQNVLRFTVLLSLRQDFIAQLDDLRFRIPSIQSSRYRIKKFDFAGAYAAVIGPLGEGKVELDAILAIVRELGQDAFATTRDITRLKEIVKDGDRSELSIPDEYYKKEIDPTLLSLYCHQLYNEAPQNGESANITASLVERLPRDKVIQLYYERSLPRRRIRHAIEKYLITPDGRRLLMDLTEFSDKAETKVDKIEKLKDDTAIVRIYGINENRQIELAHDRIAAQALASRKKREADGIKLNALIGVLAVLAIVAMVVTSAILFVREQKKQVNIIDLTRNNTALKQQSNMLQKAIDSVNSNYRILLSSRNSILTNSAQINKYVTQLQATSRLQEDSILAAKAFVSRQQIQILSLNSDLQNLQLQHISDTNELSEAQRSLMASRLRENGLSQKANGYAEQIHSYVDTVSDLRTKLTSTSKNLTLCDTTRENLLDSIIKLHKFSQQLQQQIQQVQQQQKQPQQQQQQPAVQPQNH